MFTLAQAAREARLLLKYGGIVIAVIFALIFLYRAGLFIKELFFPTPIAPPEERFGAIPKLDFKTDSDFKPTYRIDTTTGFLPAFSDRAKVFKFKEYETNILTVSTVRKRMSSVGFSDNEKKLDEIIYQWTNNIYPEKTITYNIYTKSFEIKYPFYTDNNVLSANNLSTGTAAVSLVQNFLTSIGEDVSDIDFNKSIINYYRLDSGKLTKISSKNEAQIVQVSLFQKSLDNLPILYKYHNDSDMTFYLGASETGTHIVDAYYRHRRINESESSTYSIITSDLAYTNLQNGQALILTGKSGSQIDILNVYLAYFMNTVDDEYLIPVVVFEGKNFKAYVEALGAPSIVSPTTSP